jgi:hypothetical protein
MKALISFAVLVLAAILYERFRLGAQDDEDARNYRLIRKYLLNDSSIARSGLPILWVHIEYEKNARWWPSFGSRSTDDLNQPYVYLTIKSLIDRCGGDFNICLIDDDTFGKILPGWTVDFDRISDPVKNKMRNLALTRVLYHYGGLTVPASFLCMKNLGHEWLQVSLSIETPPLRTPTSSLPTGYSGVSAVARQWRNSCKRLSA